jgi:uncharacterized membrane protein
LPNSEVTINMILFAVLVVAFVVAFVVGLLVPTRGGHRTHRDAARWAMAVAMVFSGVSHFAMPDQFLQLLPAFVPAREMVIFGTGIIEALLGIGLVASRRWRRPVALVLVAYLVAVFPANVYVAVAGVALDGLGGGNPWLRLPFQAVYIGWVFWAVPDLLGPLRTLLGQQRPTALRR